MKTLMRQMMMLGLLLAMSALAGNAQDPVTKAFDDIADATTMINGSSIQQQIDGNGVRVSTQIYVLIATSAHDCSMIQRFISTCKANQDKAYSFNIHQQGANKRYQSYTLLTANGGKTYVGTQDYKNLLIYCVSDPDKPDYRTCYTLEWTDKGDKTIMGRIIKTYTVRPGRETKRSGNRQAGGIATIVSRDSLDRTVIDMDELARSLEGLENLDEYLDFYRFSDDGNHSVAIMRDGDDENMSLSDWLTEFNIYRNLLNEVRGRNDTSGINEQSVKAGYILELCQKHPELSENVQKACIKSLQELKSAIADSIIKAMLEDAIDALQKPAKSISKQ